MGRKPIVLEAVLRALRESGRPLRFTELREAVSKFYGKKINDGSLGSALKSLLEEGLIEKRLVDGKPAYTMSKQYLQQRQKYLVLKIIEELPPTSIIKGLDDPESIPQLVFVVDNKGDTQKDRRQIEQNLCYSLNLDRATSFTDIVSKVLICDFDTLPPSTQNRIQELVVWAYWAGVQDNIRKLTEEPLGSAYKRAREYSKSILEEALRSGRQDIVEREKALQKIFEIYDEVAKAGNLSTLLKILDEKYHTYQDLLRRVGTLHGGERILEDFYSFGGRFLDGLYVSGLLNDFKNKLAGYDHIMLTMDVALHATPLDNLVEDLIRTYPNASDVSGGLEHAVSMVRRHSEALDDLAEFLKSKRIVAIEIWGVPGLYEAGYAIYLINRFTDWYEALKEKRIMHRLWICDDKVVASLSKALRAIKRGRAPEPAHVDVNEPWTLLDLYKYHPEGRNPEFWQKLLEAVKENCRIAKKRFRRYL